MPLKLHTEELPTINLTSMIDVLFLLIIFFMVGTRFAENDNRVQLNMPKVSAAGAAAPSSIPAVSLYTDGSVGIEGKRLSIDGLRGYLAQKKQSDPGYTVSCSPDSQCSVQQFFEAIEAIKSTGVHVSSLNANGSSNRSRR